MSALDFTYCFVKFSAMCRKAIPFARFDGSKGLVVRRLPRTARGKYVRQQFLGPGMWLAQVNGQESLDTRPWTTKMSDGEEGNDKAREIAK